MAISSQPIDWKDGVIYRDPEWEKLNPTDFKYGFGAASLHHDATAGAPDSNLNGFLNRYSTIGVQEDKAEIFAHMMTDYKVVALRAETDPIIKAKMSEMEKLLYNFCSAFDEAFWSKIKERKSPGK